MGVDRRVLVCERRSEAELSLTGVADILLADGTHLGCVNRGDTNRVAVQRQKFDLISPGAFKNTHDRCHIAGFESFFWNIGGQNDPIIFFNDVWSHQFDGVTMSDENDEMIKTGLTEC